MEWLLEYRRQGVGAGLDGYPVTFFCCLFSSRGVLWNEFRRRMIEDLGEFVQAFRVCSVGRSGRADLYGRSHCVQLL